MIGQNYCTSGHILLAQSIGLPYKSQGDSRAETATIFINSLKLQNDFRADSFGAFRADSLSNISGLIAPKSGAVGFARPRSSIPNKKEPAEPVRPSGLLYFCVPGRQTRNLTRFQCRETICRK